MPNPDVTGQTSEELVAWGLDIEDGLTDWEIRFLEDMQARVESHQQITEGMRSKLEQIIVDRG